MSIKLIILITAVIACALMTFEAAETGKQDRYYGNDNP